MPLSVADLLIRLDRFPWSEWRKRLTPGMSQVYRDVVNTTGKTAAVAAGGTWDFQDPFLSRWMTRYVGERIVQLESVTKARVADVIRDRFDQARADSLLELSRAVLEAVQQEYAGYDGWRASRIARTERAIAANHGAMFGYAQAGVQEVEVLDGTEDEECAHANGQIWTVASALANPIAHPNCQRAFAPLPVPDQQRARTREAFSLWIAGQDPAVVARNAAAILDRDDPCARSLEVDDAA